MAKPIFASTNTPWEETIDFNERIVKACNSINESVSNMFTIWNTWFDGELEEYTEYDLVMQIGGFPRVELNFYDEIKCIVIDKDNKKHDAIIYVGKSTEKGLNDYKYSLIRLSSDKPPHDLHNSVCGRVREVKFKRGD